MKNKKKLLIFLLVVVAICIVSGILYVYNNQIKDSEKINIKVEDPKGEFEVKENTYLPPKEDEIKKVNFDEFDDINKKVLENSYTNYKKINKDKMSIANMILIADFQYKGESEKENFSLDSYIKRINKVAEFENMDIAVSLGDLNNAMTDKEFSMKNLKDITSKFRKLDISTLFVLGNHDRFIKKVPEQDISKEEYYNLTFLDNNDGLIFNENAKTEPYYYKDLEDKKVRICVLNSFSKGNYDYVIDDEQIKFFANKMLDFSSKEKAEDWTVAVFIHTILPTGYHDEEVSGSDKVFNIIDAYKNKKQYSDEIISVDYSNVKAANFSAIFTGHHHADYTLVKNNILVIGIDTIRPEVTRNSSGIYAFHSDLNDDISMEILSIDTHNRMIYSTKVGNGESRFWSY